MGLETDYHHVRPEVVFVSSVSLRLEKGVTGVLSRLIAPEDTYNPCL